jgi:hypothetical protein
VLRTEGVSSPVSLTSPKSGDRDAILRSTRSDNVAEVHSRYQLLQDLKQEPRMTTDEASKQSKARVPALPGSSPPRPTPVTGRRGESKLPHSVFITWNAEIDLFYSEMILAGAVCYYKRVLYIYLSRLGQLALEFWYAAFEPVPSITPTTTSPSLYLPAISVPTVSLI